MWKLEKGLILVKVLFSLLISYLVILKGNAGSLVNTIGNVIVNGNFIIGLIFTITILAIYPLLLHNITLDIVNLRSLKNKLLIFDIVVILADFLISLFIGHKIYNIPIGMVQASSAVSIAGTTVLFVLTSIIILLILKRVNPVKINSIELIYNNNPFSYSGIINRLPYFITKLILFVTALVPILYKGINNEFYEAQFIILQIFILQIIFVLAFYAASKRLRDVCWSQWLLLIWAIPYVGLLIGVPLLFMKSKINKVSA